MQNPLAGQTRDWRQFGSPDWHLRSSQCHLRRRIRRSASSSLRLPTAQPIFDVLVFGTTGPPGIIRATWMEIPDNLSPVRELVAKNLLPKGARRRIGGNKWPRQLL